MDEKENFYKDLIDNLYDGVYFVDRDRKITYWNKGAERLTGYPSDQILGQSCRDNILNHVSASGEMLCLKKCPLVACMEEGKVQEADAFLHHANGHRVPVLVRVSPLRNPKGEIIGAVEVFSPGTSEKSVRKELYDLRHNIHTDLLTGIGNRPFLEGRLQAAFAEIAYRKKLKMGLLFIDIDNFKNVNDTYGHKIGDQVLCMVAATLKQSLRTSDVIGRWGGDEFVAILYDVLSKKILSSIAEKMRMLVEYSHIDLEDTQVNVSVSVGVTQFLANDTIDSIIHRADMLMYKSKQSGCNRISVG